jgi:two-component system LytT family response regulator
VETLHAILKEPAPRLRECGLGSSARAVQSLLDACLAKEPDDRYADVEALLVDLRAALQRLTTGEAAPSLSSGPTSASVTSARTGPLRVLIVDDEDPARELLREYLGGEADVEVAGECRNGFEAVKAVAELRPDLVLLDIQMPKLTGFEVLELIGREVAVIFVTAFDEHALRAFEVNAVDYLLKPVAPDRFRAALARARGRLQARAPVPVAEIVQSARPPGAKVERILVRDGAKVVVIAAGDLDYAEAQDDYVGLHTKGKVHLKQQTLAELAVALDPARFVRIHRTAIVNIDQIKELQPLFHGEYQVVLRDKTELPLSRGYRDRLQEVIGKEF